MGERTRAILEQFKQFWTALSTPRRIALVVVTLGVLLSVLVLAGVTSRPDYGYLYTELAPEDAAAIVEKLEQLKVPYRLDSGGTAIQAPRDRVHALRLELASEGLPRGGTVGFELFDRTQIGATQFEQRVSLRRALEGELARSVTTVEGVESARVHLVLPERRLFAREEESASASVVLKLANSSSFGKHEVAGIVHLVTTAVSGLSRERVSVVSTEGLTLHRPTSDAGGLPSQIADLHTEQSRAIAAEMEQRVREQLERVVGPGNADVRINVALDTTARERTEEHFDPVKTALRSEHKVEETNGREGASVAGVPGALSNLPDGTAPPEEELADVGGDGVLRRSHTRNWEVERVTEKISMPPGKIERLSVAVLLNGTYRQKGDGQVFVPRSKQELQTFEAIAQKAVGFDSERGDSISLESREFVRLQTDETPPVPVVPWWQRWLPELAAAAAVLLFLLALVVLMWRSKSRRSEATTVVAQLEGETPAQLAGETTKVPRLVEDNAVAQAFRERALELAAKDPATAAVVLRKWLHAPSGPTPARP